ncbi:MAG: aminoglycoside phosphotransferase family protein [Pseudobacteriovorax sp.]|nr:aminoglycoside phosphotransferase family protein [Pseudobacteriovorax sp.]
MVKKELSGGRKGKIWKESETVIRPSNDWTRTVHRFLSYLRERGVDFVPKPLSFDSDNEVLSFMPGDVFHSPYPKDLFSIESLKSASRLLRQFHDFGKGFISQISRDDKWMLEPKKGFEVICHGDFAPYNVCVNDWHATGIIDFDTIHPGPRLWDISYAIYRWVPLTSPLNPDTFFELDKQIHRAGVFFDVYGASAGLREKLVPMLVERLEALISYMTTNAPQSETNFGDDIANGHIKVYQNDIEYLLKHQSKIANGLINS